jgi:hypothetical protein
LANQTLLASHLERGPASYLQKREEEVGKREDKREKIKQKKKTTGGISLD